MELVIIIHNVRSAYNVGSIFRTADGAGVAMVYLSGYSPFPADEKNIFSTNAQKMISKTALGAEKYVKWKKVSKIGPLIEKVRNEGYEIVALEQSEKSIQLEKFNPKRKTVLIVGNEPKGIDAKILKNCDMIVEIPMMGKKNSLNVSVAFGIAAYHICSKMK